MKKYLKNQAIKLRQDGLSYSEILKKIKVSKSTLSLWLRSVALAKTQKQRLTLKKLQAAKRGGESKKQNRIIRTKNIIKKASMEIDNISERELWLAGIMLYWAEGSKQKETNVSVGIKFSNSDQFMSIFFVWWLKKYLKVLDKEIIFEIVIHENYRERKDFFVNYWSKMLGCSMSKLNRVYYKKHNLKNVRKNIGDGYHGQLITKVRRSTDLNRRITGWIEGFVNNAESSNGRTSPFGGEYF